MSQLVAFDFGAVPAYLQRTAASADALLVHASKGYPIMSIKGKAFAIVRDGERNMVMNPKDPESPANFIEIVMLKVNPNKSKVYYEGGYVEGSDAKPVCMSNDGIKPDARIENPQCSTCAACPKNVWGAKITENGKKSKPCQDSVRVAIATADKLDEPMLLRVPPASITALADYGRQLKSHGVGPSGVVTRIGFDIESPTPLLTFKPVAFLSQDGVEEALEVSTGDAVQAIIGAAHDDVAQLAAPTPAPEAQAVIAKAAAPQEAPKITRATKKVEQVEVIAAVQEAVAAENKPQQQAAPAVVSNFEDIDLDNLGFD